jgi:hypothetical protein
MTRFVCSCASSPPRRLHGRRGRRAERSDAAHRRDGERLVRQDGAQLLEVERNDALVVAQRVVAAVAAKLERAARHHVGLVLGVGGAPSIAFSTLGTPSPNALLGKLSCAGVVGERTGAAALERMLPLALSAPLAAHSPARPPRRHRRQRRRRGAGRHLVVVHAAQAHHERQALNGGSRAHLLRHRRLDTAAGHLPEEEELVQRPALDVDKGGVGVARRAAAAVGRQQAAQHRPLDPLRARHVVKRRMRLQCKHVGPRDDGCRQTATSALSASG